MGIFLKMVSRAQYVRAVPTFSYKNPNFSLIGFSISAHNHLFAVLEHIWVAIANAQILELESAQYRDNTVQYSVNAQKTQKSPDIRIEM